MSEKYPYTTHIGRGWAYPPTFTVEEKGVTMVVEEKEIEQSLEILLWTETEEREMRPDFGCDLGSMVFEQLTTTYLTKVKDSIETAIIKYEPRIELHNIRIDVDSDNAEMAYIHIDYSIRSTDSRFNLVLPFYASPK